ncbi:hypothetical protein CH063_05649 [Colletotrichum higginsianum]|uniref:Uncharacterized protein n=1 Tax=Colletotrichum higginsianum (strain IMI 349063) TaxID=759273 RepID=H1UZQ9_COLHI|nr:hypothetical protein CH063_05649 [Colletotrichum higginsianum]
MSCVQDLGGPIQLPFPRYCRNRTRSVEASRYAIRALESLPPMNLCKTSRGMAAPWSSNLSCMTVPFTVVCLCQDQSRSDSDSRRQVRGRERPLWAAQDLKTRVLGLSLRLVASRTTSPGLQGSLMTLGMTCMGAIRLSPCSAIHGKWLANIVSKLLECRPDYRSGKWRWRPG